MTLLPFAYDLDCPEGLMPCNERSFMMNHADGWMGGWTGGEMWIWPVIGVLVVVFLVVAITKMAKK